MTAGFQTTIDLTQYRKNIDYQKPGSLQPNYQFSSSSFGAPPSESRESPVTTGNNVMGDDTDKTHDGKSRRKRNVFLRIDTGVKNNDEPRQSTPATNASATPKTPTNLRGSRDLRSPGGQLTPVAQVAKLPQGSGLPDFITQTDANGNAITPRSNEAIQGARIHRSTDQKSKLNSDGNKDPSGNSGNDSDDSKNEIEDPCDMFFENLRAMCCCLVDDHHMKLEGVATDDTDVPVKLLGPHHPDDVDKPCLVLDLDETLVHSSFRAVPNSDFVIPVRIEDVTHFVYVAKRPGVDDFLLEMSKHYEIVIYTASLDKYANPLLDLLDKHKVIRTRLFREHCVYYKGNYVKDLSLLDRDLTKTIIIDNSPASYMFHPENAIDCTSWIDDRSDRELDQIGSFLVGIRDAADVRGLSNQWRDWPAGDKQSC